MHVEWVRIRSGSGGQLHQGPVCDELPGRGHLAEGGVLHQGRLPHRSLPRGERLHSQMRPS